MVTRRSVRLATIVRADRAAGSIAYAAQLPCVWSCSIRDNILFGAAFDEARYSRVLDACALRPDLAAMPAGDRTEIGFVDHVVVRADASASAAYRCLAASAIASRSPGPATRTPRSSSSSASRV